MNFLLKHTIQEARPMRRDVLYSEYGMPSTHAQFMWFFAAYMTLFVLIRYVYLTFIFHTSHHTFFFNSSICFRLHQSNNSTISERFWRVLIIAVCIASAGLVTYSRIYLQYHSHSQVLCGAVIGTILGIVWFIVVHLILTPFFPVIVSW